MPWHFLPSFKSTGLSVLEKKFKIDFQDGGHYRFWILTTLALLIYRTSGPIFPSKFGVSWPFGLREVQNSFNMAAILNFGSVWFVLLLLHKSTRASYQVSSQLAFVLQVTPMLPWLPIGTILASFDLCHPNASYQIFKSAGILVQEKKRKIAFHDGPHRGHLWFMIGTILAIFLSTSHPDASNLVSKLTIWFRRKSEK